MTSVEAAAPPTSKRGLWAWVLGCAAGAALVLLAVGRTWVSVAFGGAHDTVELTGAELAPAAQTLALAALAAIVAVLATRGLWRRLIGAVVALCGAGVAALALLGLGDGTAVELALRRRPLAAAQAVPPASAGVWAYLAAAGGLVLVVAGVVAVARGARWPGMSDRYERQAPEASRARDDRSMWEAMDRGDDPTA